MPLDLLFSVKAFPRAGSKTDGLGLVMQGGGPVPNVLVGLRRLGHSVSLITAIADDLIGRIGLEELTRDRVDKRFVVRKSGRSDTAAGLIERKNGRRTMVLSREIHVRASDIKPSLLPRPRIIHLDGRDMPATMKLARWGRREGALISFDIGTMRNDVSELFPLVDHLVVADSFALPLTGKRTVSQALRGLQKRCSGTVVITEGLRGATGIENDAVVHQPAFRVHAVDTTGAGDAFHAGYLYGLLHGCSLAERLRYGSAVAALKCTRAGARAGLPSTKAVFRFLRGKRKSND